jgi:hypothetical protein
MGEEKTCFVIAPIGEPGSSTRKRSDQVMTYIIKPIMEPLGYEVTRADDISEPGIITIQVIQRVVDAPLVVADLTGHNPNVFYELAIRHAIKKPWVQLIGVRDAIPFDLAGMRTIKVNINDLDSVEEAKIELGKQVQAIETGELKPESPITQALDLRALERSDDPLAEALARIQKSIAELSGQMRTLCLRQQAEPEYPYTSAEGWPPRRTVISIPDLAELMQQYEEAGHTQPGRQAAESDQSDGQH